MLLSVLAFASGHACKYLELRPSGGMGDSLATNLPYYLAYPDTLGQIAVRPFLESEDSIAKLALTRGIWESHPLKANERRFLSALKNFVDGHIREAGLEIAAMKYKGLVELGPYLRIDRGLLLIMGGFPQDAEKEWLRVFQAPSEKEPCAEGAWRNLYSFYLAKRNFEKANGLVDEALKVDPKNKWANFAKGYLLRMLAPGEDWEMFMREKSSWKDSLFEIQIAYGKFLKDQNQLTEAAKYYNRGLEGAPHNGPAWLELADIYYQLGFMVFAETCLRQSFFFGITDPYVFELYSLILQSVNKKEDWVDQRWRGAERILEEGFPHDLHSRRLAQLLYHVYCHNGKVEAASNLRESFWFHFQGPRMPRQMSLSAPRGANPYPLKIAFDEISFPLVRKAGKSDFYEPF